MKSLNNIFVRTNAGMAPIKEFVNMKRVYGPQNINRFNLFTSININANAADGYFVFDIYHVRTYNYWDDLKQGFEQLKKK